MGTQDENPWVRHDSRLCKCNAAKPLRVEGDPTCNVGDVQSLWPHQKSKPHLRFLFFVMGTQDENPCDGESCKNKCYRFGKSPGIRESVFFGTGFCVKSRFLKMADFWAKMGKKLFKKRYLFVYIFFMGKYAK
jgi:hypothetical protein